jgi:hypothetical protein
VSYHDDSGRDIGKSAKSDIYLGQKSRPSIGNIDKVGQYLSPYRPSDLIIEEDNYTDSSGLGSDSERRSPRKTYVENRSGYGGLTQMSLQVSVALADDRSRKTPSKDRSRGGQSGSRSRRDQSKSRSMIPSMSMITDALYPKKKSSRGKSPSRSIEQSWSRSKGHSKLLIREPLNPENLSEYSGLSAKHRTSNKNAKLHLNSMPNKLDYGSHPSM